ncbi:MAG: preprotein translocase subunit SecE, partial [Clostridia bacterium]|nr:preprotein translocase subunit SecE [Clostridia bacterium]
MSEQNSTKSKKTEKKSNGFVNFFKGIGSKLKGMWSELKKVSWPKFSKVVKNTGI